MISSSTQQQTSRSYSSTRGTIQSSSTSLSSGQVLSSYNRREDSKQSVRSSSSLDRKPSLGKSDSGRSLGYSSAGSQGYSSVGSQGYSSVGSQGYSNRSQTESTQYSRDRQEGLGRQTGSSGRQKWYTNDNRGSVSPGKENMEQNGYRSRSATRSPSSRLFSSTVASRAKQINHSLVEANSQHSRKYSNRSGSVRGGTPSRHSSSPPKLSSSGRGHGGSVSAPGRGHGGRRSQDRETPLQSYTDFKQVAQDGGSRSSSSRSKSYSSIHRTGSSATTSSRSMASSSSKSSSDVSRGKSSGSGSVKILSSLKKASIDSWDNQEGGGGIGNRNEKRKSVSSVYIG